MAWLWLALATPALAQAQQRSAPDPGAPTSAPPPAAVVSAGERGFSIRSADGAFQLRLRVLLQVDGRASLFDPQPGPTTDTFLLRRVRPSFEATVFDFVDLRLTPDFGQGTFALYDAYADLRLLHGPLPKGRLLEALTLRVGKFKPEIGLERLQADANLRFIERAYVSDLVPIRDTGVQLSVDLARGGVLASVGVFNGAVDGALGDTDVSPSKDLVARLFVQPFRLIGVQALADLGVGVSYNVGRQAGTSAAPNLPSYKSVAQATFFSYLPDGVASGLRTRISPQLSAYVGRFGLLAEYIANAQQVARGAEVASLTHQAWEATAVVAITGETEGFEALIPRAPLEVAQGRWGALELAARVHALIVDPAAFPTFADPARSASRAEGFGVAVNWIVNRNVRVALDYDQTRYAGGAQGGGDRATELALLGRLQLSL